MSYAAIMVHVDAFGDLGTHVRVASALAERFHAHFIGISSWAPTSVFLAEEALQDPMPSTPPLHEMKSILDIKGQQFRAAFNTGVRTVEWRSGLDFPSDYIAREARAADLLVIGRQSGNGDPLRSLDPGALVLKAGRPILLVPKDVISCSAKRVAIAWKDTREARRAVADALPLLDMAESVKIVEVCADDFVTKIDDVSNYLDRHRIHTKCERLQPMRDTSTAQCLLQFVRSQKIDLLVAGGYGHSRLGEWIFGGVTRALLRDSPICCLLTH
jgi:nucleotide-binding universal stress UspA family protein